MRQFIKYFETMVAMLFVAASLFLVHSIHAAEFNGVEYEMPDGVDLSQEFQLLEKLRVSAASYHHDREHPEKWDWWLARPEIQDIWKNQWGIELPKPDAAHEGEAFPLQVRSVAISDLCHRERDFAFGVRNSDDSATYYMIVHGVKEDKSTIRDPCTLRYVFLGTCITRDASGSPLDTVRPTGSVFYFNDAALTYTRIKDGQASDVQLVWCHKGMFPGQLIAVNHICENGSLTLCEGEPTEDTAHQRMMFSKKDGAIVRWINRDVTGDSGKVPYRIEIESESRLIDSADYWMPWGEKPPRSYNEVEDLKNTILGIRKHRIAWPVETESASIVSDVVESATESE